MKKAAIALTFYIGLLAPHVFGQSPTRHPGVIFFEQGKFPEAIRSLESASKSKEYQANPEVWNFLGLSYLAKGEIKKSRKAFEKAVSLDPKSSIYNANLAYAYLLNRETKKGFASADLAIQLDAKNPQAYQVRSTANLWSGKFDPAEQDADRFLELAPTDPAAYLLKSEILVAKLGVLLAAGKNIKDEVDYLKRAAEVLDVGVARTKGKARYNEVERERDSITAFYKHFARDRGPVTDITQPPAPEPGVTPLRILYKQPAKYTDAARTANVEGAVRLAVLFGASGKIEYILVLTRLGYGLDKQALEAAKAIKFQPKLKDGKPVPSVLVIEYSFTIY